MRRGAAVGLSLATLALPSAQGAVTNVAVSRLPGPQAEPAIAVDPSNPQILVAGSNSFGEGTVRAYGSTDGGATWTATTASPIPESNGASCAGDPGVAIDLEGRQYYSFLRSTPCTTAKPLLHVARRAGPDDPWGVAVPVAPLRRSRSDDKPAIAVDLSPVSRFRNRVYVAWTRVSPSSVLAIQIAHSDDGGRTWSRPVKVNRTGREESYASVAVARNGVVYVAWDDFTNFSLKVARSTDGGAHFGPERTVTSFSIVTIPHCGAGIVIPAQRLGCIHANPVVSVDRSGRRYSGRVYVSYAKINFQGAQGVHVAAFDARLRPLLVRPGTTDPAPVAPLRGKDRPDQFWPQSAVDPESGALWVCFYDTRGDPARTRTHFSCSLSRDGARTWLGPVRAASAASDETVAGADSRAYGDYEGLAVAGGVAHPIWTDSRDLPTLQEEIYTTRLAETDVTRPAAG